MALSKTQVDKLGERLRKAEVPSDDDLRLLSEFREERRVVMDDVGSGIAEIIGVAPARRLKTINSIVDKLRRETARLSQVQDIAGLRIVGDMTLDQQDILVQETVGRFPGSKVIDRRPAPSHGYRAVHVVVSTEGRLAEVQVRTALQHTWALLVERLANAWGQQIKYGGQPDDPDRLVEPGLSRKALIGVLPSLSGIIASYEPLEALRVTTAGNLLDITGGADTVLARFATAREGLQQLLEGFSKKSL